MESNITEISRHDIKPQLIVRTDNSYIFDVGPTRMADGRMISTILKVNSFPIELSDLEGYFGKLESATKQNYIDLDLDAMLTHYLDNKTAEYLHKTTNSTDKSESLRAFKEAICLHYLANKELDLKHIPGPISLKLLKSKSKKDCYHFAIQMEKINDGYNLADYIIENLSSNSTLDTRIEALKLLRTVAADLRKVHSLSGDLVVVHRDIKPENIVVKEGETFLIDFGSALINEDTTIDGEVVGTYTYMSPEQALEESIDNKSDIYSLGIIILEMILKDEYRKPPSTIFELVTNIDSDISPYQISPNLKLENLKLNFNIYDIDSAYDSKDLNESLNKLLETLHKLNEFEPAKRFDSALVMLEEVISNMEAIQKVVQSK